MSIENKVLRLEREILGRNGLPRWALEVAEEFLTPKRFGVEAYLEAIRKIIPEQNPEPPEPTRPHPISEATTVEGFASDLVTKFKTRENYTQWQQARYQEGGKKMQETIDRLKRLQGNAA